MGTILSSVMFLYAFFCYNILYISKVHMMQFDGAGGGQVVEYQTGDNWEYRDLWSPQTKQLNLKSHWVPSLVKYPFLSANHTMHLNERKIETWLKRKLYSQFYLEMWNKNKLFQSFLHDHSIYHTSNEHTSLVSHMLLLGSFYWHHLL